jgi:hypothetical protein
MRKRNEKLISFFSLSLVLFILSFLSSLVGQICRCLQKRQHYRQELQKQQQVAQRFSVAI